MNRYLQFTVFTFVAVWVGRSLALGAEPWPTFQNGGQCQVSPGDLPLTWSERHGIVWSATLDGYGQSTPVIYNSNVYVTFCAGDNKERLFVRALSLETGKTAWQHILTNSTPEKNSGYVSKAAPTPAADANGVIAFFEGGNLVAFDHHGKVRWERDLVSDYGPITARHGLASSLEQNDQHVFVWVERTKNPYVLAVEKESGKTVWKAEGVGKTAWSSPRLIPIDNQFHLVLSGSGRIVGLNPADGKLWWSFEEVANNTIPTPIPLGQGHFLMGASEGRGEAAAPYKSNGVIQIVKDEHGKYAAKYLWRAEKAMSSFGSPIMAGGNAYFVNRAGVIYCLDGRSGKQHFAKRSTSSVWATPLHIGDRIYFFGRDGTTTVIRDGDKFEVLAENSLWNTNEESTKNDQNQTKQPPGGQAGSPAGFGGPVLYAVAVASDRFVLRRGDRVYCVGNE